jgi:hypothetical protein
LKQTEKQMSTAELRNRPIEKILKEASRLLDLENGDIEVFKLNDAKKKEISEARGRIKKGKFLTEEAANKEIDEWLNE